MKTNRDFPVQSAPSASSLVALVDSSAAAQAAARLYKTNRQGLRYCCDSRELVSAEEGLARDAREAARRAPKNKPAPEQIEDLEPMAIQSLVPNETAFDDADDADDLLDLEASADEDHLVELDDEDIVDADADDEIFEEFFAAELD